MADKVLIASSDAEFETLMSDYADKGFSVLTEDSGTTTLTGKNPINPFAVLFWLLIPAIGWIIVGIMVLKAVHGGYIVQIQKPAPTDNSPESAG